MAESISPRSGAVRQRLLQAAAELIVERGWSAATTRVLAERAGVGAGLVHYHFASVQTLLTEAATGAARKLAAELGASVGAAATTEDLLSILVDVLDEYTGRDPMSLLLVEAYLAATRDDGLRRALGGVIA